MRKSADMSVANHRTKEELEAGLHEIFRAPREVGTLEMIVRRLSDTDAPTA